jgi:aldehyde:ferredoxin oxidoreductase
MKKILRIDLSNRRIDLDKLDDDFVKTFVGGSGIASVLLSNELHPDIAPLDPANPLLAITGPFTATRVPSSSRHHIVARSPLTGILGESNVGGSWGVLLRKSGFDGISVTGRSDNPVYIWIHEGTAEIRDARPIWGKDTYESAIWIKGETSEQAAVAVIGQAGERLAPIAGIPHIGSIVRSASRTGLGAVMGSKNLKAIAVFGTRKPTIAHPEALDKSVKKKLNNIRSATETFGKYGTSGGVENYEKIGNFPIQNWRGSHWSEASNISGVAMHDTVLSGRKGCWRCPIACGRHIKITDGPYSGLEGEGPEYESIGTLGGLCMVQDLPAICQANQLCNRYGLDTISTGATVAFAMEAFEKGIITIHDTDGIDLSWGNATALVKIIHKIGKREGIGELMSQGSKSMAEALGGAALEFAIHVKGLEPSAHDPRRFFSQALSYCTAARGACHNASWSHPYELSLSMPEIGIDQPQDAFQIEGKAKFTSKLQDFNTAMDCLILCRFAQIGRAITITDTTEWLRMITGWDVDVAWLMNIGEKVFNLKRLYNTNLGISRKDDFLPLRFMTCNRDADDLPNRLPPIGVLLSEYYQVREWDETGIPTTKKLNELGIAKFRWGDIGSS